MIELLANICEERLELKNVKISEEYFYNSLSFCVIDAVFSISANYKSTSNTVKRYAKYYDLDLIRKNKAIFPEINEQESISSLIDKINKEGITKFTNKILNNKQRTSFKNGILKSEAVLRFAKILKEFEVEHFQDIVKINNNNNFIEAIKTIPGQKSGVSLSYFYMLAGDEENVKADRRMIEFLEGSIGKVTDPKEIKHIISEVCKILNNKYEDLNPRKLDNIIWRYMRNK